MNIRQLILIAAALGLASCNKPREEITIYGQVTLSDGQSMPPGYVIEILEWRSTGFLYPTGAFPVALIRPQSSGEFSFSGWVCEDVVVTVPFLADISARREDLIWEESLQIEATVEESQAILESDWPDVIFLGERDEAEVAAYQHVMEHADDPSKVPCHGSMRDQ